MSERFSFSGDRPLMPNIVVDGNMTNLVWSPQDTSVYSGVNSTLTDTMNDGYVTANEDNDTQYLSVLDSTSEISLENMNLTLENPKLEMAEEPEALEDLMDSNPEDVDNQVVVFTMEGSNELYGIQLAQDEEGNIHKYQFQFRKNELGQLEAIPETVQVLPMDDDEALIEQLPQESAESVDNSNGVQIFVGEDSSHEHILPDDPTLISEEAPFESECNDSILNEPQEGEEEEQDLDANIDIKPVLVNINVKQEIHDHQLEYTSAPEEEEEEEGGEEQEQIESEPILDVKIFSEPQDHFVDEVIEDQLPSEHDAYDTCLRINEYENEENQEDHENQPIEYVEENFSDQAEDPESYAEDQSLTATFTEGALAENPELLDQPLLNHEESEDATTTGSETFFQESAGNDSDNDDFHIVEGVHITGDIEETTEDDLQAEQMQFEPNLQQVEKSSRSNVAAKTNILRHVLKTAPNEITVKKDNRLYLYLVHPEKENVHALSSITNQQIKPVVRTNPRSILKTSLGITQQPKITSTISSIHSDSRALTNNKRFARGKEAMQAKLFNNFINKTTIPQAPVRKVRLPRKQEIKPVERMDEEIVVQEVMVSSNGFIESNSINKQRLKVTQYVDLTDSDFEPKKKYSLKARQKSKRNKSRDKITISSDSESDREDDVIELDDDDDDDDDEEDDADSEYNGGETENDDDDDDGEDQDKDAEPSSPSKRRRGRPPKNPQAEGSSESLESPSKKLCLSETDKVEILCPKCPKTFPSQNSLKTHLQHHNLQNSMRKAQPQEPPKYKCSKCEESFKNRALLERHSCTFTCPICQRKFPNSNTLNAHKRFHAKERLCKMSSTVQISPKKIKSPPSKNIAMANRCKICGKTFSSPQLLLIHGRSHRDVACATCSARFPSRILLEKHVRENCVKVKSSSPRRSNRLTTTKTMTTTSPTKFAKPTTPRTRSALKYACAPCSITFSSLKLLLKHQALTHGLDTPDKSYLNPNSGSEKKKLHKPGKVHGGVPSSSKLSSTYFGFKKMLESEFVE